MHDSTRPRHVPALDGVRGLAIAGVLACHFGNAWPGAAPLDAAVRAATDLGWIGVDLFFVLSGFLITGILVDARPRSGAPAREVRAFLGTFLARRALRIFPLYFLVLGLFAIAGPATGLVDAATLRARLWWYVAYLGNWAYVARESIPALSHFWSLAVEEQFYLLWPLAVLALRGRRLAFACAALVLAGPALRAAIVDAGWPAGSAYRATPGRVDALALGGLLALALRAPRGRAVLRAAWAPALAAGLAGFAALGLAHGLDMHARAMEVFSHTLLAVAAGGLVAAAVTADAEGGVLARVLGAAPLRALGRISYGLYVLHLLVHVAALRGLRATGVGAALLATRGGYALYALAGVAVSVALAAASFRWFERPFLALKDRVAPARGSATPEVVPSRVLAE